MPHGLPHCSVRICGQPGVQLQLPQGDHGPDGELLLRLLDGIQPQTGQINGGADVDLFHLEPDHAADDPIVSLLVELPGFLEAFGPFVFPDRHHTQYLSFFDCYFYFITKSLIMPLERLPQIRQIQEE